MEPHASGAITATVQTAGDDDQVTSYGWKALAGSVIAYSMDGFDMLILGFMFAAISADLKLTNSQAGSLVTWTLMGAVLGGFIFGALSDHFGRIRVLTWTILIFAAFTGLCAFARGYCQLVACRVIAGLGLGGEFGIGMTLAAEAWPASKRARASSYVSLGWQSGVLLAALVTPMFLPIIGCEACSWSACCLHSWPSSFAARSMNRRYSSRSTQPRERELVSLVGEGWEDIQDDSWNRHPLLGSKLRLLRHHDLDAELSR
jgi:MFS family permease